MLEPSLPLATRDFSLKGELIALHGDVLQGWAYDSHDPQLRLAIEIYINDVFVALLRADQEQFADVPGDGFHGFIYQIPAVWLDLTEKISARIANQGPWLENPIYLAAKPANKRSDPPSSLVRYGGGLLLRGWVYDPEQPGKALQVQAREGHQIIANCTADLAHHSLVYFAHSQHGFKLNLPCTMGDGQVHEIHVQTTDGQALIGSPIMVCFQSEGISSLIRPLIENSSVHTNHSLLLNLVQEQERMFPGACGFEYYPQWINTFEKLRPYSLNVSSPHIDLGTNQQNNSSVIVLLIAQDDAKDQQQVSKLNIDTAKERSLASIANQRLDQQYIEIMDLAHGDLQHQLHQLMQRQLLVNHTTLVVPLMVGDTLAPQALDTMLYEADVHQAQWGYADCDQLGLDGGRTNPWFKPAWDSTLFESIDLVTPGGFFSAHTIAAALATFPSRKSHANHAPREQWQELLQAIVGIQQDRVLHIPQVLYHRASTSSALPTIKQSAAYTASTSSIPGKLPRVCLIVPTRDQFEYLKPCVDGLLHNTCYPNLEIIVIDNESQDLDTLSYLDELRHQQVRVLSYPHAFNYAAMHNWAIAQTNCEIIGLINNDIEVLEPEWLMTMVMQLLRPQVGMVGAKLIWPNKMVQHGGVVVGINGLAAHAFNHLHQDDLGYLGLNQVAREQSAVTAACLILRKADFVSVGGFDQDRFPVAFNDVDLCLKLRAQGKKIVWTPKAVLIHAESASRGLEDRPSKQARAQREQRHFIRRWQMHLQVDPYYHPALSTDSISGPYEALSMSPGSFQSRFSTIKKYTP